MSSIRTRSQSKKNTSRSIATQTDEEMKDDQDDDKSSLDNETNNETMQPIQIIIHNHPNNNVSAECGTSKRKYGEVKADMKRIVEEDHGEEDDDDDDDYDYEDDFIDDDEEEDDGSFEMELDLVCIRIESK